MVNLMVRRAGILLCGGGTGGHVLPGLALARALQAQGLGPVRWIGDPERLEARLVPAAGIPLLPVGLPRPRPRDPRWLLAALRAAVATLHELLCRPPQVVVALGGYAALLPGLAAALLRRPLVVMEQNARPGRTNRLLARRAVAVVTQFTETARGLPRGRVQLLGNPVRPLCARERGRGERVRLLVMGGSLAARSINDLMLAAAPLLARIDGLALVHLAGAEDAERCRCAYAAAGLPAEVLDWVDDMASLYARVDLTLCRAGATTVAECCVAGLGALYLPLPWAAEDHQRANARAVARQGGAVLLDQTWLRPEGLARLLRRLLARRDEIAALGHAARRLARPEAAWQVARLVAVLARPPSRSGAASSAVTKEQS